MRETGIVLDIITAEEEARLAVLGCHALLEPGDGPALIFDIGGGSTELVLVERDGRCRAMLDWHSAPWGVVSLTESEGRGEGRPTAGSPPMRGCASAVARKLRAGSRAGCPREYDRPRLLGTSGTVTTLASVHLACRITTARAVDGLIVPATSMRKISATLVAHEHGRARHLAVHRHRARRSGGRGLRDPRDDPRYLAGRAAGRRRSRHSRRHLAPADGGGNGMAMSKDGGGPAGPGQDSARGGPRSRRAGSSASSTILM